MARERFVLTASVGTGGMNRPADVRALRGRLIDLGFTWLVLNATMDESLVRAINLVQSIMGGRDKLSGDGRVDVPGKVYPWLQAVNAPRWGFLPAGSPAEGFVNAELADSMDRHDFGVSWLGILIRVAGAAHLEWLKTHADRPRALLTLNDASLPTGGETPDHAGHETGLAVDLRLPRMDGSTGGVTWQSDDFDRETTEAHLRAIARTGMVRQVFFNDPKMIAAGLCQHWDGHDDHLHVGARVPPMGPPELVPDAPT